MKNVYGLANAMKVVESACADGEITIIGGGKMPSPVELYAKCVAYINEMYGVDILAMVKCPTAGAVCDCDNDDEDEDEEVIVVNLGEVEDIVEMLICENMGYLNDGLIEDIVKEVKSYYEDIDGNLAEGYDTDYAIDGVYDALGDCLDLAEFDEDYIDDIISTIVKAVDKDCISIE